MGGEVVLGTQSTGVIAMLKHVSLYAQETNKFRLDTRIDEAAHRESEYACGNATLLDAQVKKGPGRRLERSAEFGCNPHIA